MTRIFVCAHCKKVVSGAEAEHAGSIGGLRHRVRTAAGDEALCGPLEDEPLLEEALGLISQFVGGWSCVPAKDGEPPPPEHGNAYHQLHHKAEAFMNKLGRKTYAQEHS